MRTASLTLRCEMLRRLLVVFLPIAWLSAAPTTPAWAQTGKPAGKQWAILIGVEQYKFVTPLRFTMEDVKRLATTLENVGGYSKECIFQVTDNSSCRPTKKEIMEQLPQWLKKVGPDDSLLVYFSGHGFLQNDQGFLAPIDINGNDLAATGIPTSWMRQQLAACPAHAKLLILDSCHAGAEKSAESEKQPGVSAGELGNEFEKAEGVVTLASSTAKQKSQIWEGKEQSLFSYWLNQGLKGHADRNQDGDVDIDELYNYVSRNVQRTARDRFSRPQDPRRIIGSDVSNIHVVVHVKPQQLADVLADMSEQLADLIELRKYKKVGVLEFKGGGLGEVLGTDFGILGQWCADDVQRQLLDLAGGRFGLVTRERLKAAMEAQGRFALKDLGSTQKLQQLSKDVGGLPLLAQGSFRNRAGRIVNLQCELIATDGEMTELVGQVAGSAALTEREWAMLGRSVDMRPESTTGPPPSLSDWGRKEDKIAKMDTKAATAGHPLQDPKFAWPVKIMVKGKERRGVFRGNDYIVGLRKGEEYEIWVENRSGRVTFMQLLVDGLNTLRQPDPNIKGVSTTVIAPRVSLKDARAWVLETTVPKGYKVPTVSVPGFCTEEGENGEFRAFTVVAASESVAGRMNYTDQLGLITLAFYGIKGEEKAARGGPDIATTMGVKKIKQILKADPNLIMGTDPKAVVNIRYVDADSPELAGRK